MPLAVLGCGQLVTLSGAKRPRVRDEMQEISIIHRGAMLIRDGLIEQVGARAAIERLITAEYEIVDADGRVVLPGFIDAHTHPVFAGTRIDEFEQRAAGATYEEIAAAGGGIRSTVRKTRTATEDELLVSAERRLPWFLRNGTTTIEAKSGYGLSLDSELKMLRVIRRLDEKGSLRVVPTFLGAHEIADEFRNDSSGYVDLLVNEMLPVIRKDRLAEYCDIFCEPKIFTIGMARRILQAAKDSGLGLRVHADQLTRSGAAQLAAELHAATADHLEQTDDPGMKALAAAQVQPVLLPGSAYMLVSRRYAAAREMIEHGLALVLATDFNPGSSPTPSIPFVLSLASTQMRLTPAEALTAVTVNAAYSLGHGDRIGSLEAGKQADFVIHDCSDYREIAYFAGVEPAGAVYIGGKLKCSRHAQT